MLDSPWRIQLFGQLSAKLGDRTVSHFQTQKTASLLAYLAFYLDRSHSREVLAELLWPDSSPEAGRSSLSVALSSLRRQLEPPGIPAGAVIVSNRISVGLNSAIVITDVSQFLASTDSSAAMEGSARLQLLSQAVDSYRGTLLPGFYEDWVLVEQQRLASLYLETIRHLVNLLLSEGETDRALAHLHRAAALEPMNETLHHEIIRIQMQCGQQAAAVEQFQALRTILKGSLGEEPSAATRELLGSVERDWVDTDRQLFGWQTLPGTHFQPTDRLGSRDASSSTASMPAVGHSKRRGHLPLSISRFFGREDEIHQIHDHFRPLRADGLTGSISARLVTVTGPGGSGKTRLAVEAARLLSKDDFNVVFFVPLADITDAARIPGAILEVLDQPYVGATRSLDHIADALAGTPTLLLLDNLEQMGDAAATVIHSLLLRASDLSCLVTSRRVLGLTGEREVHLAPLPVPGNASSLDELSEVVSVRLLVDRAQCAVPDFQLTSGNAAAVAGICRRLEGIPLALELAAARIRTLTPSQILANISTTFELLVGRGRDNAARHQTLRAAADWSYQLLSPELKRLFIRLSVFRGGWSLEAAEFVGRDPLALDHLTQLRECSLINSAELQGEMRFNMLEWLRDFAGEQLTEQERLDAKRRHLEFYMNLAEAMESRLHGPEQTICLDRMETDHDNFNAALVFSQIPTNTAEIDPGLRLCGALTHFWRVRGHWEVGRNHALTLIDQSAMGTAASRSPAHASALFCAGVLAGAMAGYTEAEALQTECLERFTEIGDRSRIADALQELGTLAWVQGENPAARTRFEQSLEMRRADCDQRGIAWSLLSLANVESDPAAARRLQEESIAISRAMKDKGRLAVTLNNSGVSARMMEEYSDAARLFEESLVLYRELGDRRGMSMALGNLASAAQQAGDFARAERLNLESLALRWNMRDRHNIVGSLENIARLDFAVNRFARSLKLFAIADTLRDEINNPLPTRNRSDRDRTLAAIHSELGEKTFEATWREGRSMPLHAAVDSILQSTF